MSTIRITWTPGSSLTSSGQEVHRKRTGGSYSIIAYVSNIVNIYDDTSAVDNLTYIYKIVNKCTIGGSIDSDNITKTILVCPTFTVTSNSTSVTVGTTALTGTDATFVNVQLYLASTGALVSSFDLTVTGSPAGIGAQSHAFTGLTALTAYSGIVTITDGTVTKTCSFTKSTTA